MNSITKYSILFDGCFLKMLSNFNATVSCFWVCL